VTHNPDCRPGALCEPCWRERVEVVRLRLAELGPRRDLDADGEDEPNR
jgi:hypothetical protein